MRGVLLVLLGTLAFGSAVDAWAESFRIEPGAPYTTKTVFSEGKRFHVTVSGELIAEEGSALTGVTAYHCLSGSLCEGGRDPLHVVPSPFSSQNFVAGAGNGEFVSFYGDTYPAQAPGPDFKYEFDIRSPIDDGTLTFATLPEETSGYYPYHWDTGGFDFTITELAPPKRVRFAFDVDGFPDRPEPDDLPGALVATELETRETTLRGDVRTQMAGRGVIRMTTTYLKRNTDSEDERIRFELDDFGPVAEFSDEGGERSVSFPAQVTGSTDPRCPRGSLVEFVLAGGGGKAVLAMKQKSEHGCVSDRLMVWRKRSSFKRARISKLENAG
jgi:hypothetical protein